MAEGEELKNRIIKKAEELFMRFGIKNISMDEISRSIGLSKKTLYSYFLDKDDLVFSVIKSSVMRDECDIAAIAEKSSTAFDEAKFLCEHLKKDISKIHPSVLYDLQKYHPKAWEYFVVQRDTVFQNTIEQNLKRGMEDGTYRKDLDYKVLSRMRILQIMMPFNPESFSPEKYDIAQVHFVLFDHFIRGLLTFEGLSKWESLTNKF